MGRLILEDVAEFVAESCRAQGLAEKVTDPKVLEGVVVLLGAGRTETRVSGARPTARSARTAG